MVPECKFSGKEHSKLVAIDWLGQYSVSSRRLWATSKDGAANFRNY